MMRKALKSFRRYGLILFGACLLAFTGFYELFEQFSPIVMDMSGMMPVASLLSGVLTGLATGLVLRYGAATGGDDILSLLLSKYTGLSIGTIFLLLDGMVLCLSWPS